MPSTHRPSTGPPGDHRNASTGPGERVLAVDYGERRVGLALAEPGAMMVRGLPTIDRKRLKGSIVDAIAKTVADHRIERIILGVPYSLDGTEGPAARLAREFEARLAASLNVPVEEWDERLTTEAARTRLREIGYSEREMRERIDQLAAVLMLEAWLRAWELRREREAEDG